MANIEPNDPSGTIFDERAKSLFEFLLPELASTVYEYVSSGPEAVRFITGDGHRFIWSLREPITKDPYDQKWVLECVSRGEIPR